MKSNSVFSQMNPKNVALILAMAGVLSPAAASAQNLAMPSGAILAIDGQTGGINRTNTADQFSDYTVTYTPSVSGNQFILFAFREDPAYWTFGNVSLTASGDPTNLLVDPNFSAGGEVGTSGVEAPQDWGIVYQNGTVPAAAGTWHAPGTGEYTSSSGLGVNTGTSGSWYDGAVGSFDGIYQGVDLTAGTTYIISFSALAN